VNGDLGVKSCDNALLGFFFMTRPLRIDLAGDLYQVTTRGNGREAIYLNDADRDAWLTAPAQVCECWLKRQRRQWRTHIYLAIHNGRNRQ